MRYIIWYSDASQVDSYEKRCDSLIELLEKLLDILKHNFHTIKIVKYK